jgi:lipopolysaccharide export system permease protein
MKIVHKSILKELIVAFILSLASLNFILMMEKLLKLSRFLSGIGTSILDMIRIILYIQPQLFILTIPMALLLSTLLVYGRLNFDNEIIILRNNGMNFFNISLPVAVLGILCFLLNIMVGFYLGPKSSMRLREEITNIIKVRTPLAIEEERFNTSFKDTAIYVKERVSDKIVRGIFIYDNRDKNEPRVLIAKEGEIYTEEDFDINFYLKDGYINVVKGNRTTELFFKKYNMVLRLESDMPSRKKAELTPYEIMQKIKREDRRDALSLYLELHRRISSPLLCIILIFFGPPLAMMAGKSGRLGGLTLALAVFTVYYMLLLYGENLVKAEKVIHYIGAWSPSIILGILTFLIFKKEYSK